MWTTRWSVRSLQATQGGLTCSQQPDRRQGQGLLAHAEAAASSHVGNRASGDAWLGLTKLREAGIGGHEVCHDEGGIVLDTHGGTLDGPQHLVWRILCMFAQIQLHAASDTQLFAGGQGRARDRLVYRLGRNRGAAGRLVTGEVNSVQAAGQASVQALLKTAIS